MTKVIIISGASGVGKSTLAKWLAPRIGARLLNVGDLVIRAVLAQQLQPSSRAHAGELFLNYFGELALGPLLLTYLRPPEMVILDGLRLPFAADLIKGRAQCTFHIHLEAPEELRKLRLLRRDGILPQTGSVERYLPALRGSADLVLANESRKTLGDTVAKSSPGSRPSAWYSSYPSVAPVSSGFIASNNRHAREVPLFLP